MDEMEKKGWKKLDENQIFVRSLKKEFPVTGIHATLNPKTGKIYVSIKVEDVEKNFNHQNVLKIKEIAIEKGYEVEVVSNELFLHL